MGCCLCLQDFLLGPKGKIVASGIYPMDGGGIEPNGSMSAGAPDPALGVYQKAGMSVMPCFGGGMLPRAAFARRHAFAGEVLAWVLKYLLQGLYVNVIPIHQLSPDSGSIYDIYLCSPE